MAKAHIIPKSFILFGRDPSEMRYQVSERGYKQKRPTGTWDSEILCLDCESELSVIDSQAAEILQKNLENNLYPFGDATDSMMLRLKAEHTNAIKRFLLFVLWRASVSKRIEFAGTKLGAYEDRIQKVLKENSQLDNDDYGVIGCIIKKPTHTLHPFKSRFSGINYYTVNMADLSFCIKLDQRPAAKPLNTFLSHECICLYTFETPPDGIAKSIQELINKYQF